MTRGVHVPVRTCAGCGQRDRQAVMLRLRAGSAGTIEVSPMTGFGRSAYVHPNTACIDGLRKSKRAGKSLRRTLDRDARERLIEECLRCTSARAFVPADRARRPEVALAQRSERS